MAEPEPRPTRRAAPVIWALAAIAVVALAALWLVLSGDPAVLPGAAEQVVAVPETAPPAPMPHPVNQRPPP